MVKIRVADPSLFTAQKQETGGRAMSPAAQARQKQDQKFQRMIGKLRDESQVFQVRPEAEEKPATVRLRLLRAAREQDKEIAVRKHGDGFIVGLMTPERRSTRGRKPRAARTE